MDPHAALHSETVGDVDVGVQEGRPDLRVPVVLRQLTQAGRRKLDPEILKVVPAVVGVEHADHGFPVVGELERPAYLLGELVAAGAPVGVVEKLRGPILVGVLAQLPVLVTGDRGERGDLRVPVHDQGPRVGVEIRLVGNLRAASGPILAWRIAPLTGRQARRAIHGQRRAGNHRSLRHVQRFAEHRPVDRVGGSVAVSRILADERKVELIARLPEQAAPHGRAILVAQRLVVDDVLYVAVALMVADADARGQLVLHDGNVDRAAQVEAIVVTVAGVDLRVELARVGPSGDRLDHAAGAVCSEQGALGAPEDLDALDVVGVQQRHHVEVLRHLVLGDHHGGPCVWIGLDDAHAADVEHGAVGRVGELLDLNVGNVAPDRLDGDGAEGLHPLARDGGDGDRYGLDALHPTLRGDHDLLDLPGRRLAGVFGQCWCAHTEPQQRDRCK